MFLDLALWQEVSLIGLALLSLVYVFYFRIWVAMAMASDLLFVAALMVCTASIAMPSLFDVGARQAVNASPLPEALLEADAKVAALESLPAELIARALAKVGYERDPEPTSDTDASRIGASAPEPGPFESRVRPAVETLISVLLRGTSCMASFFVLLMALALRSSTSTARELQALSVRLEQIEAAGPTGREIEGEESISE